MNFSDFTRVYAKALGCTLADSKVICDTFVTTLLQCFKNHENVYINSFGNFIMTHEEPYEKYLFGEKKMTQEKWKLKFKPSLHMMDRINNGEKEISEEGEDDE